MTILRIEHRVSDFERWKQAFESDPVGRAQSGVRRYRILRSADDPNYVMIDLEFDDPDKASALLVRLRELWSRVDVMRDAQARLVEVVESKEY
jgi:hypothetical protein